MAGPAKNRTQQQKQQQQQAARSSDNSSSSRHQPTQRSINKFDGNKDPIGHGASLKPIDYTRPNDLKNLSEFLGMAGWAAARGVSTNAPILACICMHAHNGLPCILTMQTSSSWASASHGMAWMHSIHTPSSTCSAFFHHDHTSFHSFGNSTPFHSYPIPTLSLYIYLYL